MKKFVYSFILILSMAVFVSCSTETVIDPIVVPMADVTLNVTNEEGSSRYIYLPTQNGGFQVDWSVGDKITLLYNKHNGTETVWKAVNLELITNNGDGNVVFSGKVPADYGGTYIGVYPAMNPKADGNQPYEVKAGKVYNDIQGGKSAIVQYFTDILKNTQQVQVNDNDMRHVEALDYQVTNCEFKCVENNGNRVLRNATMEPITFKHVFSFAKMSISKSKLPRGAYPIGISLAGYWGSYGTPVKDVEYSVLLEGNFQNNSDKLTFWMVMPEGKLDPGKSLKFTVYALPMREEFTFAIANGHTVISGIDNVKAKVYNYDIDKFTPSHVQSLFYAWGNLDGYDSRVDPHKFSVNNCGLKGKKEYDIERYLKGFTAEKTGILDGKFSFAGLLDPKPKNIGNVWANDPANIGQPLGIGDPAAYWSNGVLHTPTKTEWEKLLNLAGINGSGNPIKDYHNTATGELANRVGGHDTDFWVAEDKDGQPIMNVAGLYGGDANMGKGSHKFYAWRVYPRWATKLSDPFIKIVITGCNYYDNWGGYSDTRYWTSSVTTGTDSNAYAVLFYNGKLPDAVTAEDRANGCLIVGITDINDFISPTRPNPCKLWDMWHPNN